MTEYVNSNASADLCATASAEAMFDTDTNGARLTEVFNGPSSAEQHEAAYQPVTISALAPLPYWVAWQLECRSEGEDPTKIPYVRVGIRAMANDSRWINRKAAETLYTNLAKPFEMGGVGI
ncbi:MAG TPA: hypothetical protein PLD10_26020, partial [Rhodopila sp.]|nr:hypothetical protein [Rhodopila sp.]